MLDQRDSRHILGSTNWVGRSLPNHVSVVGKVFLAEGAVPFPEEPLERLGPRTITDPAALCARARGSPAPRGYATAVEELEPGLWAVAAPVRDAAGAVVAALSISGPTARLHDRSLDELGALVRDEASTLSVRNGYDRPETRCCMSDEEIDLSALPDDELVAQMHDDLYDGLAPEIAEGTNILLARGWDPDRVLERGARRGHAHRRHRLPRRHPLRPGGAARRQRDEGRDGDPAPAARGDRRRAVGKVVIGTVKGDIHDIGKNLVAMMLEGAGFEVFDLGINTPVEKYLEALEEHQPDILGMSALLTTTMPYMKVVIDTLKEKGLRDNYIVLVGGAPLNEEFGQAIGADAYCRDAAVAAETAKALVHGAAGGGEGVDRPCASRRRRSCSSRRSRFAADERPDTLVLACGALAREILALIRLNRWTHVDVRCLPAKLHSTPEKIAGAVDAKLTELEGRATSASSSPTPTAARAALLDGCSSRHGVERLPGAHCYGFFAGNDAWDAMQEEEVGTFYLTDFLARHFDAIVVRPYKLDVHPELAADDVRQLHAPRLPRADRRSRRCASAPRPRRRSSGSRSSSGAPATATCCRR